MKPRAAMLQSCAQAATAAAHRQGRRTGVFVFSALVALAAGLGCGSVSSQPSTTGPVPPGGAPTADPPVTAQERPVWVEPDGGVAVDSIPQGTSLRQVDAFGNLWFKGCEGLYVASEGGIRRYRYTDTPWERGGDPLFADQQGRVWYSSDQSLSVFEAGEWRYVAPGGNVFRRSKDFVVGSDGVAWTVNFGTRSGDFTLGSIWPEVSLRSEAPRWEFQMFPGRDGELWYRTALTAADELWHFDGQHFAGPFTVDHGAFFYDQLDDTVGITRSQDGELIKVRFDGTAIVEASRSPIDWLDPSGRQRDGLLIARNKQGGLIVLDGDEVVPLPFDERDNVSSKLSPTGELYLLTTQGVYLYQDGQTRRVLEFGNYTYEPPSWQAAGYPSALRAASTPASKADFAPELPAIFGQKVSITGFAYYTGFETPSALVVDGETVNVTISVAQEFYAFAEAHDLKVYGADTDDGVPPADAEPWNLIGYLEPGPCYEPGQKTFHVVEAYPLSLAPTERATLEAELRQQHAP